jgi:glycosyltransferase involved in cell wall biosynthesis
MSPFFSIVTPVYNPPIEVLEETIQCVLDQVDPDWELLLVDDASPDPRVRSTLERAKRSDQRIKVLYRAENGGIIAASNDALAMATGEFVVLLDHDDLIEARALKVVRTTILDHPDVDYIYSDEDHLSPQGRLINPFYKPDWSPQRLRSQNYCCHLSVFRKSLIDEIGGFRTGFEGSQDYDLILRATEKARSVHHIPEILYHWRQLPTSVAGNPNAKPHAYEAGRRAIQEHCDRIGIDAVVESKEPLGTYRLRRKILGDPLVSIIIPTCGSVGRTWGVERYYVVSAVQSILEKSTWNNVEFVIVVDIGTPDIVISALRQMLGDQLRLVWFDRPFNFSEKINLGRVHSSGEFLLLLNDDIEVISEDFIETMIGIAQEEGVGSVGAKLLFSDGTLQHAGHVYNGDPYHIFFKWNRDELGPSALLCIERECIGVTAACLMTTPEIFDNVGGMTTNLDANFNDVDFALKLQSKGYRAIWTPDAELYHFESISRDPTVTPEEQIAIRGRWNEQLEHDPYYNSNLSHKRNDWVERGNR